LNASETGGLRDQPSDFRSSDVGYASEVETFKAVMSSPHNSEI